jgi:hypothetical protein
LAVFLFGLIAVAGFVFGPAMWAWGGSDSVRLVRVIETAALGYPDPVGLAFSPRADSFLILEAPGASRPPFSDIVNISHRERFAGSARFGAALSAPLNMAFDGKADRLLVFEPGRDELIAIAAGADGFPGPDRMTRIDARYFGVWDPRGMTVDPWSGHLFMLDGLGARIVHIEPDSTLGFARATIEEIGFEPRGLAGFELRGIALDPTYEVTDTGLVVANRDLSGIGLVDPQAIVFAPSGDMTDDPAVMSLYVADGGGTARTGGTEGGIIELSLTAPRAEWQER